MAKETPKITKLPEYPYKGRPKHPLYPYKGRPEHPLIGWAKENKEISPSSENKYDATKEIPQWERQFIKEFGIHFSESELQFVLEFIRNLLRQQEEFWELKIDEEKNKIKKEYQRYLKCEIDREKYTEKKLKEERNRIILELDDVYKAEGGIHGWKDLRKELLK